MKKKLFLFPIFAALSLSSCSIFDLFSSSETKVNTDSNLATTETGATEHAGSDFDYTTPVTVTKPDEISVEETSDAFSISTSDGSYSSEENIYVLTQAGTYTLKGKLEGQIRVEAGDDDEVVIELSGASITYNLDSPIKVINADKVEISAKKNTGNIVKDTRSHKTVDSDEQGEGAISAKCDLKLKGTGTLIVEGNYNNGVHTTKDLTIQKQTLKVTGYNNALKGKDSITIISGTIQAYAQTGNGLKTENSDLKVKEDSSTVQRGKITVSGGTVYVDSLHDALDASYDVIVEESDSSSPTSLTIVAGKKSSFYSSSFVADSEKGLKAKNNILVSGGEVVIAASDDAIHANYGDELENGSTGTGNITVDGGVIKIASGDDGFHADNTLTVNGGKIYVTGSYEGLEGSYIVINGGETYVYGSDDGVNVSSKITALPSHYFLMNGGYLDVAVNNGDTDGIDSNGAFTLAGGIIITRGSPGSGSGMSTGLDVDGSVTMTGGTMIAFNGLEKSPTVSSGVYYAGTSGANSTNQGGPGGGGPGGGPRASSYSQSYTFPAGNYSLKGENIDISFINDYGYSKFCIYSSNVVSNATYTLSRESATIKSWTQSSKSVTIS